jgi:hypothetical protein
MTIPTIIEYPDNELLVIRLSGSVDRETLQALARELNRIEAVKEYSRYLIYVENITSAAINSEDAMFYRNKLSKRHIAGKAAMCAFNILQFGMARMFQAILENELLTIEIFRDIESAANWLEVDKTLLGSGVC